MAITQKRNYLLNMVFDDNVETLIFSRDNIKWLTGIPICDKAIGISHELPWRANIDVKTKPNVIVKIVSINFAIIRAR